MSVTEFFDNLSEQLNNLPTWAKTAVGVVVIGVPVYAIFCHNKKRKSPLKTDYKPGVVYVYQFPRSPVIPSLSPYCLKLETWLRMADINYENVEMSPWIRSKEGMLPFIELDGKEYDDSGLIVKELSTLLKKDSLESNVSTEQKGAARAFEQMMENCTLHSYAWVRYVEKIDDFFNEKIFGPLPFFFKLPFMKCSFRSYIRKRLYAHGIGRHTADEVVSIGLDDLKALSMYLGGKKFICGDQPTRFLLEADATLFGSLAQMVYIPFQTPHGNFIKTECHNLTQYCDRMKERYWPDWEEVLKTKSLKTTWKKK